jgi:hypothetical protein
MGDDNEITALVRKESEQFLSEARRSTKDLGKVYNLEDEFEKTKKNRSILVWAVTIITIAALAASALVVTSLIRKQTAATPVEIGAFQDLNLRDLLDRAKRDEADLEQAKLELTRTQAEVQTTLDAIDRDAAASIDAIKARGLSQAEETQKIAEAKAAAQEQRQTATRNAAAVIAQKKALIKSVQDKVDSYNQRLSEQTRKQQEVLDNQTQLFNIEKQKLIDTFNGRIADLQASIKAEEIALKRQREELASSLTSKWNPTFDDAKSLSLLGKFTPDPAFATMPNAPLPEGLYSAGAMAKPDTAAADGSIANFLYLSAKLRSVPYLNSVPPALARMEYEARAEFVLLRTALDKAGTAIEDRDRTIADLQARLASAQTDLAKTQTVLDQYRWATSQYVLDNREGGYIVDSRNSDEITVALNPAVPVAIGTTGYVVRTGDKAIATLSFYFKDGQVRARVLRLSPGEQIKAFDPIILVFVTPAANVDSGF